MWTIRNLNVEVRNERRAMMRDLYQVWINEGKVWIAHETEEGKIVLGSNFPDLMGRM